MVKNDDVLFINKEKKNLKRGIKHFRISYNGMSRVSVAQISTEKVRLNFFCGLHFEEKKNGLIWGKFLYIFFLFKAILPALVP